MSTISEVLAEFVLHTQAKDIPEEIRTKTKYMILDGIGLALGAAHEDFANRAMVAIPQFGQGDQCTAIGFRQGLPVVSAPLINGMLIFAFDFDDTHEKLVIHNESVALPAALAAAEYREATGLEFLLACAVGFEVSLRVSRGAELGSFHARGYNPAAVCGVFGAAAAAGRIFGLTHEQQVCAFGLAGSQGSGNQEWQSDGTWSKRFQPGWSAHGGVVGALLAEQGFTAPATALEGPRGFYATHVGLENVRPELAVEKIGEDWEVARSGFKLYPSASLLQSTVHAAVALHDDESLVRGDIEDVECRLRLGREGQERTFAVKAPESEYGAHFSIPYVVAVALTKGRLALTDFEEATLRDPEILELASKVRVTNVKGEGHSRSAEIVTRTKQDKVYENRQVIPPGYAENPVTSDQLMTKFVLNAGRVLPPERVDALALKILAIDELESIHSLTNELRI